MPRFRGFACGQREYVADQPEEMANLSIRFEQEAGTSTIRLAGELDAQTAERFTAAIEEAERSQAVVIVVDLTEVQFIDSTGLVTLLMASRRSDRQGRGLRVRAGSGEVRHLLELTAIDERLNLID